MSDIPPPNQMNKDKLIADIIKDDTWMVVDFVDFLTDEGDDDVPKLDFYIEQIKADPTFKLSPFQLMEILNYSKKMETILKDMCSICHSRTCRCN